MDPFHTAPANDTTFWSRFQQEEDRLEAAIWSELTGCVPPVPKFSSVLSSSVTDNNWGAPPTFKNASSGGTTPTSLMDPMSSQCPVVDQRYWFMATHPFTEVDPIAPRQSNASWTSLGLSPARPVPEPRFGPIPSSSGAPVAASQAELAWSLEPNRFINTIVPCFASDMSATAPCFDFAGNTVTTPCHTWGSAEYGISNLDMANIGSGQALSGTMNMVPPSRMALGKHPRCIDETDVDEVEVAHDSTCKRAKEKMATSGVLAVAGFTSRAHQIFAARTPERKNHRSQVVGHGARRLVTLSTQGVYDQSRPGPSVQESAVTTAHELLSWEERGDGAAWHHAAGASQQVYDAEEGKPEETEGDLFRIPKRLTKRHRALLKATSEEWARGAVSVLKCRLCPRAGLSKWGDFRRHCDTMEAHPLNLFFCDFCGDFFGRYDALLRHCGKRPRSCLESKLSVEMVLAKRKETEKEHAEFESELEGCLKTNGEIRTPFAQRIKEKNPGCSKRGSRQQCRLKAHTLRS